MSLTLTSPVFNEGGKIPTRYTCDGENCSPPLTISGVPRGAQTLVLVMDDPDIPDEIKAQNNIERFDHWVLYDIPADTGELDAATTVGSVGLNSHGDASYTGPCPPRQYEPTEHRYVFRLFALAEALSFDHRPTLTEVETAAKAHALDVAELLGRYERPN